MSLILSGCGAVLFRAGRAKKKSIRHRQKIDFQQNKNTLKRFGIISSTASSIVISCSVWFLSCFVITFCTGRWWTAVWPHAFFHSVVKIRSANCERFRRKTQPAKLHRWNCSSIPCKYPDHFLFCFSHDHFSKLTIDKLKNEHQVADFWINDLAKSKKDRITITTKSAFFVLCSVIFLKTVRSTSFDFPPFKGFELFWDIRNRATANCKNNFTSTLPIIFSRNTRNFLVSFFLKTMAFLCVLLLSHWKSSHFLLNLLIWSLSCPTMKLLINYKVNESVYFS